MPRSKDGTSKYTKKQERKAEHIEEGYEKKGVSKEQAEKRAWATVNKQDGGGKNPGGRAERNRAKRRRDRKNGFGGNIVEAGAIT